MLKNRINPEKITHPFQLMASWFVMLVLLVYVILRSAENIDQPTWAPGFLVISVVILSVIVILAVFLMLTKFRPHLQESKEYAEWLKDERRLSGDSLPKLQVRDLPDQKSRPATITTPKQTDVFLLIQIMLHPVTVCSFRNSNQFLSALRSHGFKATIYEAYKPLMKLGKFAINEKHTAIWIGSRVPPRVAILAIKIAVSFFPHLCYLHLSTDSTPIPPDNIHDEIFIGGTTTTAEKYRLLPWTQHDILQLLDDMSFINFHELIRSKYSQQSFPDKT